MQLSIKTPPALTLPLLEKCVVLAEKAPSHLVTALTWQCLKWMDRPHSRFRPLELVRRYYRASGREDEFPLSKEEKEDAQIMRLMDNDRARRSVEAAERVKKFKASLKRRPPPKHLHLKISQGMRDLPQCIKAKAEWLRMSPNALVVACVKDGLEAMDDPAKARVPPPIVVQFWSVSHAKERRKPVHIVDAMMMKNLDEMLRQRGGPILDTIIRFALSKQWDVTLREILQNAEALSDGRMTKD